MMPKNWPLTPELPAAQRDALLTKKGHGDCWRQLGLIRLLSTPSGFWLRLLLMRARLQPRGYGRQWR